MFRAGIKAAVIADVYSVVIAGYLHSHMKHQTKHLIVRHLSLNPSLNIHEK